MCERKDVTSKSPAKQSQTSRPRGRGRRVMPPPGQPHPSHPAVTGGGKCHHPVSPLPLPPRRSVRSGVSCGWDVPWSAGASRAPLAAGSLAGGVRPWRWAGAAQRWRQRDISCSRHKAKPLPAPAEKVNSVPAKTGTSTRGGGGMRENPGWGCCAEVPVRPWGWGWRGDRDCPLFNTTAARPFPRARGCGAGEPPGVLGAGPPRCRFHAPRPRPPRRAACGARAARDGCASSAPSPRCS